MCAAVCVRVCVFVGRCACVFVCVFRVCTAKTRFSTGPTAAERALVDDGSALPSAQYDGEFARQSAANYFPPSVARLLVRPQPSESTTPLCSSMAERLRARARLWRDGTTGSVDRLDGRLALARARRRVRPHSRTVADAADVAATVAVAATAFRAYVRACAAICSGWRSWYAHTCCWWTGGSVRAYMRVHVHVKESPCARVCLGRAER